MKTPNNDKLRRSSAEAEEGRHPTKRNMPGTAACRTQSREQAWPGLEHVREAARKSPKVKFTALLHHITVDALRDSYFALNRNAAPGVDEVTWRQYAEGLEARLTKLHERVHTGTYRAQPSKRDYIPKADGRLRPLGITALEDKILQQAVCTLLGTIHEEDFLGFSYGFRPKRSQHDALDALWVGLTEKKVNWVLDADIQGFFDNISHEWMRKLLEHRIADGRVLRLVDKWLRAGVSEDGEWSKTTVGTPQGAVVSPLLANIFLHYVFDLWVQHWRTHRAKGDMVVVRYADDFVIGFQDRGTAERCLHDLRARLAQFGLSLHPEKTRLLEFGRYANERREKREQGKSETFNFLGFTHICSVTRANQKFTVLRLTIGKRMKAKVKEVGQMLLKQRHQPVRKLGIRLGQIVRGYFQYHAIPGNTARMNTFRYLVSRAWLRALKRRSQRCKLTWDKFGKIVEKYLPKVRVLHPWPSERFHVKYSR